MAVLLLLLSLVSSETETELHDGKTVVVDSDALFGTENFYTFKVGQVNSSDLTFTLTSFSDFSDPDMYLKVNEKSSYDNYDYKSISWGSGSIVLSPSEIKPNSTYHLLVSCYTLCKFGVTASLENEIQLSPGLPISGQVAKGHQVLYQYPVQASDSKPITLTVSSIKGQLKMFVVVGADKEPNSDNTEEVETTWNGNLQFKSKKFKEGDIFRIAVIGEKNSSFTIMVSASNSKANFIQAGVPVSGEVAYGEMNYYLINVLSSTDVLSIGITVMSGYADIYVRAGELPETSKFNFSATHGGNESIVITGTDRKKIGSPTGNYFIGIYGFSQAAYTLTVKTSNSSFIRMTPGIPECGAVSQSSMLHFYIDFPEQDSNITLTLLVESGNPDLFAQACDSKFKNCIIPAPGPLSKNDSIFSSQHNSGSETIEIAHKASSCKSKKGETCHYIIGVYGVATYSSFTLLVTTNTTDEILLQDGVPSILSASGSSEKYFRFKVFNESVSEVLFMLTPIYGDTDIYGSFNQPILNFNYQKSSMSVGVDTDQIKWQKGVDSDSLVGIYHLMVFGTAASSFSIVAKTSIPGSNSTIQIFPGHPQKDTVYNISGHEYRIYTFPVHFTEETKQKIAVSLSVITGKFTIYVANKLSNIDWKHETFLYDWKSSSNKNHSDLSTSLVIDPNDKFFLMESTYAILVMADKFLPDHSATFIITLNIGNGTILLSEDVPYTGVVVKGEYSYFMFPVHYSTEDISISLTCISGDADLYVSVNPNNTHPSFGSHDYKATSFENEKLTLTWEQNIVPICKGVEKEYKFGNKSHCYVYIGVYGFDSATFIIRIHPASGLPAMLTLGQPMNGNLSQSEYGFYYQFVDVRADFKITVQPIFGDPDLYVNIYDKNNVSSNVSSWIRPNKQSHQFSSSSTVMTEVISFRSSDLRGLCKSELCLALAAVYCTLNNCSYFIQTSQINQSQVLIENQATYAASSGDFVYFSYYSAEEENDFLVQVTAISGDPDLYVSKGTNNYPTEASFDWVSNNLGHDTLLITKSDPYFTKSSMKGTYVIGVKDTSGNCSFTIIINNHPVQIHRLASGVPQHSNQTSDSSVYYSFFNYIKEDVTFVITPTLGNVEFYVNSWNSWEGEAADYLPSPEKFKWSSSLSPDKYHITILTSDIHYCAYCTYLITVKTDKSPSVYTLTAQTSFESTLLQDGAPVRSHALKNKWTIFSFEVLSKADIYISLTPYTGLPNLYVSKNVSLGWENFEWTAYAVQGTLDLLISKNDLKYQVGVYYIVVETLEEESSFSLVAHTENTFISLIDGLPIFYSIPAGGKEKVTFKFTANHGHFVYCYVKSFVGVPPNVFTKFQALNESPVRPSEDLHDNKFDHESFTEIYNYDNQNISYLAFSNVHTGNLSQLNIAVYPFNKSEDTQFEIHCSGKTESSLTKVGSFDIGILDEQISSKRYEMAVRAKGTLDAYVLPCLGEFKLEISSNWTVLNQETSDIVVSRMTDGVLAGSVNHAQGTYFMTVSAIGSSPDISVYEFMTVFTSAGAKAKRPYKPGNSGLIEWKDLKEHRKIRVSWEGLEDEQGQIVNETVEYRVYFTPETESELITACGVLYHSTFGKVKYLGVTKSNSIEIELPHPKGFINVLAMLSKSTESALKSIIYDPTEISIPGHKPPRDVELLFELLVALLLLAIATAVYFYKKNKKTQNILNFEMNDVRNVANVTNSPEMGKRPDPYSSLA